MKNNGITCDKSEDVTRIRSTKINMLQRIKSIPL